MNQLAELGNRGWLDTNKNGVQDNSEAGEQNVTVTLLDVHSNASGLPQFTDANGNYLLGVQISVNR
ncbi:MAG: SdrD B-like domain-containing protein [Methylococcaceae bacterium]|nr:SdrD B-like domain-containing protein [Methylococcaceae bacterium]MDP3904789.1 SdrD B-like domain-containing protein [Methylococcaceae bacterium]